MRIRCAARALTLVGCLASFALTSGLASAQPHASPPKPAAAQSSPNAKPAPKGAAKASNAKATPKGVPPKTARKGGKRPLSRKPGEAGEADEATRKIIAGTAGPSTRPGERSESPELRAIRELDMALFPAATPREPAIWASDTVALDRERPNLVASGVPPAAELAPAPSPLPTQAAHDLSWLRQLEMPDIPVRWDARVVRYLEFYKESPRGRSMVAGWIKKSGRYGGAIRRILREQGLPEDILWLSLVESGFDPTIGSPVGAAGLWQFMPEGARIYGLTVDRWIDERLDPERSTVAAAKYLADLHKRFGGWELAFAAYNMGYGGLLSSIRKYNTNDYWELSRFEAGIPYETALYVPKIVAMAIVARNRKLFGCDDVELDAAVTFDRVAVGSGVSLRALAVAAGATEADVLALNPQVLATRTPPTMPGAREDASWVVRVPPGTAPRAAKGVGKLAEQEGKLERYEVRWGETLEDIAARRSVTKSALTSLNGIRREEVIRPGTLLFVPARPGTGIAAAENVVATGPESRPYVVVPREAWSYPERRRLFYRPVPGDTLREVASELTVTADELARWNALDPGAALHDGMTLQAFVPTETRLDGVLVLEEKDARVLTAGSEEFFTHFEALKGRRRVEIAARDGDSWRSIGKRYGLTLGQLERINQRSRSSPLAVGDKLIVYMPSTAAPPTAIGILKPSETESVPAVVAAAPLDDDLYVDADHPTKPASLETVPSPPAAERPSPNPPGGPASPSAAASP